MADCHPAKHDVVARLPAPAGTEADGANARLDNMSAGIIAVEKPKVKDLLIRVGTEGAGRQILKSLH
jgi:hypothetical protein